MLLQLFDTFAALRLRVGSNSCLVDEVDADAELQARGVERVVRCGKIGIAAVNLLIEMGPSDEEAGLLHLEVGIEVHDGKVAAFHLLLTMEGHRRGVVDGRIVLGVVVAVHAQLHV